MKSEHQIEVDFHRAKQEETNLSTLARELRELAEEQFEEEIQSIRNDWQGMNAENYIRKCRQLKQHMLETARELERASDSIRMNAEIIYKTEMEAKKIVQTPFSTENEMPGE